MSVYDDMMKKKYNEKMTKQSKVDMGTGKVVKENTKPNHPNIHEPLIDKSKPLDVCKIEVCKYAEFKSKQEDISIDRALGKIAEETEIPYGTIKRWFYPKSAENYNKKRRDEKSCITGDTTLTKTKDHRVVSGTIQPQGNVSTLETPETHQLTIGTNKPMTTVYTGDAESYTPSLYIETARKAMGSIDIDPASNPYAQNTVSATVFYTQEDDGLTKDWNGNVWLNPPYNVRVIDKFVDKLITEMRLGNCKQAILLTNNSSDTKWFHCAANNCNLLCFTKGRINFYKTTGETTSPTNGQTFFYFGSREINFKEEFKNIGLVMEVV